MDLFSRNNSVELGTVASTLALREGLREKHPVIYTENGNRSVNARAFLKRVEKILPRIGVSRIGDISFFAPSDYPVFQSCRPGIATHASVGQNTGSQGKGPHAIQAKLSCIMETMEGYCCEAKNMSLVRGSYNYLKKQHLIVNPKTIPSGIKNRVTFSDELMWTEAYSVTQDLPLLVPAEAVFFPFFPKNYETEVFFTTGSNGVGAGATYTDATIHALYEVIERHYWRLFEDGEVECEALHELKLGLEAIEKFNSVSDGEFEIQLYNIRIPGIRNLPIILCMMIGEGQSYLGFGCSMSIQMSIDRAISEAFQSMATIYSGAREDLHVNNGGGASAKIDLTFQKTKQPRFRTMTLSRLRKTVVDKQFRDLESEYLALVDWLHKAGFKQIYLSNLTRIGVDIPVVRALVPGLKLTWAFNTEGGWDSKLLTSHQYQLADGK